MKLLYLADNSDLRNWGCRATSTALRELVAAEHEIVGVVGGEMIEATYPLSDIAPDALWGPFSRTFNRSVVRRSGVLNLIGRRNALSHDLDANIATLKRARAYDGRIRAMFEALDKADGVVVNGEGDLIFQTPARDRLLFTLTVCELGLRAGKPLYYLNAMVSECPVNGVNRQTLALAADVLGRATAFTVRDAVSAAFVAREMPGVAAEMFPDALFSWADKPSVAAPGAYDPLVAARAFADAGLPMPEVLTAPYLVLSGGSRASRNWPLATERYIALVAALKAVGLPVLLMPTCDGDGFLTKVAKATGAPILPLTTPIAVSGLVLAHARVMVSGRWHPSIMASLGGVPTVFMGSNSHKTLTIQSMLEQAEPIEFEPMPGDDQIAAIVARTQALLALGDAERARILEVVARLGAEARKSVATITPPPAKAAAA